jgi:outer membrane protein assembly factor BamB/tetratricopeptide (TPR) repeat protein
LRASTFRASLLVIGVALLSALMLFQTSRAAPEPAGPPPATSTEADKKPVPDADQPPTASDLFTLPADRQAKKKIEAAGDYIKEQAWGEAVRLLQSVLDSREDVFIPTQRKDKDGKVVAHWLSARSEAMRLFGALPPAGLEFYQLHYGPPARALLKEGKSKNDPRLLDEAARRFFYTVEGLEAMSLVATYHLDRGRFGTAAACFGHLLQRQGLDKAEPLTLFKATLAFEQSGDRVHATETWKELGNRVGAEGLRFGKTRVPLAQLRQEIDRPRQDTVALPGWPLFRGDAQRTGQARGDMPYLEPRWQHATVTAEAARRWLDYSLRTQDESLQPTLPGSFPLAVNGRLIYRSHAGIQALDLKTGQEVWTRPLGLSLEACMTEAGKKVTVESWLRMYGPNGYVAMNGMGGGMGALGGAMPPLGGALGGGGGVIGIQGGLGALGGGMGGLGALGALGGGMGALGGGMIVNPGSGGGAWSYVPSLLFENTALGTLSSDHHHVYAIDDLVVPPHPNLLQQMQESAPRFLGPISSQVYHNRLLAINQDTGAIVWFAGGPGPLSSKASAPPPRPGPGARGGEREPRKPADREKTDKDDEDLRDAYFLGPPLSVGGNLYVLVEKHSEVRLVCLDPHRGDVLWMQTLAILRDKILQDVGRRLQAAQLAYADGILVCPTHAGAIFGFDLLSRSLLWAHAYRERPPGQPEGTEPPGINPSTFSPLWKASAPIIQAGKVIFTAADGDSVRCLQLRDGALLWKLAHTDDDAFLAGVFPSQKGGAAPGQVVIVGKTTCRAVSLADGTTELWKVAIGQPSGQGVASGSMYYLPLRQGICALDLEKGQIVGTAESRTPLPTGNLFFHEGDLLSQSTFAVAAYPQLKLRLAQLEERISRSPRDAASLTERGELRLYQGDLFGAVADLRLALASKPGQDLLPRTHAKLYDAMTQLFQKDFAAAEKHLEEYRELCHVPVPPNATPEQRLLVQAEERRRQTNLLCLIVRGREQQPGRLVEALRAYEDLYRHDAGGRMVTVLDDPIVQARLDVWVQGRITALFQRLQAEETRGLQTEITREWQRIQGSEEIDTLESFVALYGPVATVGNEARLQLAERLLAEREHGRFLEAELLLLQVQGSAREPVLLARATEALARLCADKGFLDDALLHYRRLVQDFAGVVVRDGLTGGAIWEELQLDKRFLPVLQEGATAWKSTFKGNDKNVNLRLTPQHLTFEPPAPLPPFFRRHALVLDLIGSRFRVLERETGNELWSQRIALDSLRPYLVQNGYNNNRQPCWVQGHLVVLSLGTAAFGIDLLDRRVLWRVPLFEGPFQPDRMSIENLTPDRPLALVGATPSGEQRVLGRLGPLGAGYVALQTSAGLVALDPLHGQPLWARRDVGTDAETFGDDQHIYLVEHGGSNATRAVRSHDGVALRVPDFAAAYRSKVQQVGHRLLVTENEGDKVVQRLVDLQTGQDLWKRTSPPNSIVLHTEDPHLAGWVTPEGAVTVVDVRTAKEVLQARLESPKHVEKAREVHLVQDRERFYLAIHRPPDPNVPVDPTKAIQGDPWNCVGAMRTVPVNGAVYAFDRASGKLLWWNQVLNQMMILEQFDDLPIVLFAAGLNRQNAGNVNQFIHVHAICKANGKRLGETDFASGGAMFHALQVDRHSTPPTIELISATHRVWYEQH